MVSTNIFLYAFRLFIRLVSNVNYLIKNITYVKPAKPYKLIYMDPFDIEKAMESTIWVKLRLFYGSGFIKKGEWDFPMQKLQNKHHQLYEFFINVFLEGVPVLDTVYFREERNHRFDDEIKRTAEMYKDKYGPMFELFSEESFKTPINLKDMSVDYFSIAIDEDGEFLYLTGKHRLALAKAAGMKKMPVNVAIRHHEWQKFRDQLYTRLKQGDITREDILEMNHPDLLDLVEE